MNVFNLRATIGEGALRYIHGSGPTILVQTQGEQALAPGLPWYSSTHTGCLELQARTPSVEAINLVPFCRDPSCGPLLLGWQVEGVAGQENINSLTFKFSANL